MKFSIHVVYLQCLVLDIRMSTCSNLAFLKILKVTTWVCFSKSGHILHLYPTEAILQRHLQYNICDIRQHC